MFNHSEEDFKVSPGDRIAQLIIEKISATEIVEVDELNDTARGAGGFGSTGISVENIKNIKPVHQVDDGKSIIFFIYAYNFQSQIREALLMEVF